ncbi:MAG: gamma-glutamyltransferase, partial [Parafilimonas sp.]
MKIFFALLFLLFGFAGCKPSKKIVGAGRIVDPYHFTSTKSATYNNGCVVSAYPLASEVGVAIMKNGGNAFDAMIATQLALAVVYPAAGNLGGG